MEKGIEQYLLLRFRDFVMEIGYKVIIQELPQLPPLEILKRLPSEIHLPPASIKNALQLMGGLYEYNDHSGQLVKRPMEAQADSPPQSISGKSMPLTGFVRLPAILQFTGISRTTWYRGIKEGWYPKPIKISARVSVWRAEEIWDLLKKSEKSTSI